MPLNTVHPILLPGDHPITRLLIDYYHKKTRHQGRIITMSAIRNAGYYIYKGTSVVKRFLNKCVICSKLREYGQTQKMNDLPADRLEENPPFTYCGMDVFGPFHVSEGVTTRRNNSTKKTWAIVFICLVTKAVHLEPLPTLNTSTFKNALRRFFSIRGVCRKLRCDQGTNFIGAMNQDAQSINFEALKSEASLQECEWQLNPPHSSHHGGIWERSIKSVRKILDSSLLILGKRPPSRDELHTFLAEASAIINNTPLYELCSDPNEPLPVTPAVLITLKSNPNPPPIETFDEKHLLSYGTRRWKRVQALADLFWKRWREEYLQTLQNRQKWIKERPNIQIGDVVLMKIKNARRNTWPMARVNDVKTSSDGLVRSVSLTVPAPNGKQSPKSYDRPISEVVPILRNNGVTHSE